ncbi:DUF6264 family protein [Rathayibacter sp. SD072]|uniref:DUF6264 family protein n=1 Tax=Rathayibacter sp. SD072 TaxID=2781731 RepID=UPI001A96CE47|nr:DUF6264 family protein [Rathayibacter sp. SD072]MBO0984980.1 hypothetical protein [Rathayibacter sp. SD072]
MSEPPLPPPPPPRREPVQPEWASPGATPSGLSTPSAPGRMPSGPGTPWTAARLRRPVRVWDLVLTIVLLAGEFLLTALLSYFGLFLAMASDACMGGNDCDSGLIGGGVLVAAGGVWIGMLVALVVSIVLLVLRRIAFWVPIAGTVLSFAATIIGSWIAMAGTGT